MKNKALISFVLIAILFSCMKEEIVLNDQIQVTGMDPSFALPIGNVSLNLGNIEASQDMDDLVYSEDDQILALVFSEELFNYQLDEFIEIADQEIDGDFEADAATAGALNLLPTGQSMDFPIETEMVYDYDQGEVLDSIIIGEANLVLDFESSFEQDIIVHLSLPTIKLNGVPFQTDINLEYNGSIPIVLMENISLDNYVIDFGIDGTTVPVDLTITITKTNETVSVGDLLDYSIDLSIPEVTAVYGYFGQHTNILAVDTQNINYFNTLNGGTISFADPRIDLIITNSAGLDVEIDFNSVIIPDGGVGTIMTGSDLTSIPIIMGANNPGDSTITYHTIDNSGTSPTLTEMLDIGTSKLVYTADATTNPNGVDENWIIHDSHVSCTAQIVLPMYLQANNFEFIDTIDVDLANILNVDNSDPNSIDVNDVEKVTLRILVDNGLPLDVGAKLYFADTLNNVLDSLWITDSYQYIFSSGTTNFSVPESDPNYGRVTSSTSTFTDFILTSEKLNELIDQGSKRLIIKTIGNTASADAGEYVKFYPEYNVNVKVSAKIDLNISFN